MLSTHLGVLVTSRNRTKIPGSLVIELTFYWEKGGNKQ